MKKRIYHLRDLAAGHQTVCHRIGNLFARHGVHKHHLAVGIVYLLELAHVDSITLLTPLILSLQLFGGVLYGIYTALCRKRGHSHKDDGHA